MKTPNDQSSFVRVFSTFAQTDIINAKMALENAEIEYYTKNETFASLYPGADGLATVDFMVDEKDAEEARTALKDLIEGNRRP